MYLEELQNRGLELYQNVPNLFEQSTEIRFRILHQGRAKISIINLLGEIVYTHEQHYDKGVHSLTWQKSQSLRPVSTGLYLFRLESMGQELVKKMLIK